MIIMGREINLLENYPVTKLDVSARTVEKTYDLENINDAIDDLKKGRVFRPLIKM